MTKPLATAWITFPLTITVSVQIDPPRFEPPVRFDLEAMQREARAQVRERHPEWFEGRNGDGR